MRIEMCRRPTHADIMEEQRYYKDLEAEEQQAHNAYRPQPSLQQFERQPSFSKPTGQGHRTSRQYEETPSPFLRQGSGIAMN
jgi:hypothetical protein